MSKFELLALLPTTTSESGGSIIDWIGILSDLGADTVARIMEDNSGKTTAELIAEAHIEWRKAAEEAQALRDLPDNRGT